ncbi:MAG TPA: hypothetical protein VFW40_04980 [Capsulimonadaceae bacterium]|nr:hypothetical protein [Capsulimonadaceae bacterium]
MNRDLTLRLIVILMCFAALTFAGSRRWLRVPEAVVVGIAIIFWATGWLMAELVKVTVPLYGHGLKPALIAGLLTLPMTLALSVGLWLLVRRMRRNEASPQAPSSRSKKKKQAKPKRGK